MTIALIRKKLIMAWYHAVTNLLGKLITYILKKANVDDGVALFELSDLGNIDTYFGVKVYVGTIIEELKRSNCKNPLPRKFRNMISGLCGEKNYILI